MITPFGMIDSDEGAIVAAYYSDIADAVGNDVAT